MLSFFLKKTAYGFLVVIGVIVIVFFLFQGFGDPVRMTLGQTGDKKTMENIRKDLYLDQPKWKQFFLYLNDLSPIGIHSREEIKNKELNKLLLHKNVAVRVSLI